MSEMSLSVIALRAAFVRAIAVVIVVVAGAVSANAQAPKTVQPAKPGQPVPGATAAAVPAGYVIGAEDVLGVVFWREADMSGDVAVRPDGRVTLPLIGEMEAAGMTPEALRDQIQKAATKYLTDANVTVIVKQINSRKVFITGQVGKPGEYPLIGQRTVIQLIALAGGLSEYAKSEEITIVRPEGGKTRVYKFNYKDVSKGKKLEQNLVLQPGDTVAVP